VAEAPELPGVFVYSSSQEEATTPVLFQNSINFT
jgi:hypothetical protein